MLYFLLSAFFMVSAGEDITVTGFVQDNVLLRCDCSNRNLEEDFKWQKDEKMLVTEYNGGDFKFGNSYSNRVKTYFRGDSRNCSILLTNITLDDQGQYRCIFRKKQYAYSNVNLNVCGSDVCQYTQSTPSGGKVYHCDVKQRCSKPEIKWISDEETPIINIFNTSNLDKQTGHYYFHSTLKTERKLTSDPQCNVTCPQTGKVVSGTDEPPHQDQDPDPYLRTLCKVVPVVLILGFLLIWCRRRGTFHRSPRERDVENSDFSQTNTDSDELQSENVLSSEPEEVINH